MISLSLSWAISVLLSKLERVFLMAIWVSSWAVDEATITGDSYNYCFGGGGTTWALVVTFFVKNCETLPLIMLWVDFIGAMGFLILDFDSAEPPLDELFEPWFWIFMGPLAVYEPILAKFPNSIGFGDFFLTAYWLYGDTYFFLEGE